MKMIQRRKEGESESAEFLTAGVAGLGMAALEG